MSNAEQGETTTSIKEQLILSEKLHFVNREQLANGTNALTIARLRALSGYEDAPNSAQVIDVIRQVGWPRDAHIEQAAFGDIFLGKDADKWFQYVIENTDFRLGNFLAMFRAAPTVYPEDIENTIDKIYATRPPLLRLNAIDSELVTDVRGVVHGKTDTQDWVGYLRQFDGSDGDNPALTVIRQAYMAMARLVSPSDEQEHYARLGYTINPGPITNIGNYLTK